MLTKAAWKERRQEYERDCYVVNQMLQGVGQRMDELHMLGMRVVQLQRYVTRRPGMVIAKLAEIQQSPLLHRDVPPRVWSTSSRTQRQPKNKT
jgi:hypothetical protein